MNYETTISNKRVIADTVSDSDNIGWIIRTTDTDGIDCDEPATLKEVLALAADSLDRAGMISSHESMIEEAENADNKSNLIEELEEINA